MKTKSNVYFPTGACPNPREGGDPEYLPDFLGGLPESESL